MLERISLLMLVGGILFEIITGVLNIQYDYIFGFSFYTAHYYGAWVFIAGFLIHIAIKIPRMWTGLRSMSMRDVWRTNRADTRPEPYQPDTWLPPNPARRRSAVAAPSHSSAAARCSWRRSPPGRHSEVSPVRPHCCYHEDVPAARAPTTFRSTERHSLPASLRTLTGDRWRLTLTGGPAQVVLDRAALTAMPQHTARLPIACVEGWSTTETWTGVPLADLARLAGVPNPMSAFVRSVERRGAFNRATLQGNQVAHPDSLLALRVNDADLSPDHGYPARIIVPALPGVHNTKWVASIDFRSA